MRLPHDFLSSLALVAGTADELIQGLGQSVSADELAEINRLTRAGLPPITSDEALSVMTGYNRGFIWSLKSQTNKHYRVFKIPKGRLSRQIEAPRAGLKLIQKWLSIHFANVLKPHEAVHGFVQGRSHITAAREHLNASWVFSVDIENFFPSTTRESIVSALKLIGYQTVASLEILSQLCSYEGRLSQGAPTSPVLANAALSEIDNHISVLAQKFGARFTRYADDIVISGVNDVPTNLFAEIERIFDDTPWRLSESKRHLSVKPNRLKVHGLLVHGATLRLTKGYRNRVRAFAHVLKNEKVKNEDVKKLKGHLSYANQVKILET
jgi:RNA-directed DNA polymerase